MLLNVLLGIFYFCLLAIALLFIYQGSVLLVTGGRKRRPRTLPKPTPLQIEGSSGVPFLPMSDDEGETHPESDATELGDLINDHNQPIELPHSVDAAVASLLPPVVQPTSEDTFPGDHESIAETPGLKKLEDDLSPQKIFPLLRRVEILIARKEYDEAKKLLIKVLSLQEDHLDASSHLAYIYLQTGEYMKAETLFRKILESRPNDASVLTNFALSILEQKDHSPIADAVEALRYAVQIDSKNAERYSNLGQALYLAGDPNGAVDAFESAIRYAPRNIEYLFFLADSYMAIRNYPYAKRIFSRILEISPLNAEAKREMEELTKLEI